ncbi:MAG: hypothetical protein LBS21_09155, partial [Clostridiales bacterium]|nr:hypothetical protein [Clostridiales bacterium]
MDAEWIGSYLGAPFTEDVRGYNDGYAIISGLKYVPVIPKPNVEFTAIPEFMVFAPNEVDIQDGEYIPKPLEIEAVISNSGDIAAQNVKVTLTAEDGMKIEGSATQNIGSVKADD